MNATKKATYLWPPMLLVALIAIGLLLAAGTANANPAYFGLLPADRQAQGCANCHDGTPSQATLNAQGKKVQAAAPKTAADMARVLAGAAAAKPAAPPNTGAATPTKATVALPKPTPKPNVIKLDMATNTQMQDKRTVDAILDGSILAPVRDVVDLLGGSLSWDHQAKTANFTVKGKNVALNVGNGTARVGEKEVKDVKAMLFQGRTYVSLVFLGENLDTLLVLGFGDQTPDKYAVVEALWSQSAHATPVASPVGRDTCVACHNGDGFAQGVTKVADLKNVDPDNYKGQYCTTCHGERGKGIRDSGITPLLPNGYQVKGAGKGALCVTCHNARKAPDSAAMPAPHRGPQSDVLFGFGGAEVAGDAYPTAPHAANPNTCISCHMGKVGGAANHMYTVLNTPEYVANTCGKCHNGLTTVNRTALGDYDGDGKIEGIQDEVDGLLSLLADAIEVKEAELGLQSGESHGSFAWTDAAGAKAQVPEALYKAAWNHALIENDGSKGVHNAPYVVSLLQKSYKELTGKDIPKASLR